MPYNANIICLLCFRSFLPIPVFPLLGGFLTDFCVRKQPKTHKKQTRAGEKVNPTNIKKHTYMKACTSSFRSRLFLPQVV